MVFDDKRKCRLPRTWWGFDFSFWNELIEASVFTTFTSHRFPILFLTDHMKGFLSIVQLFDRFIRRISMIFQLDLITRDKQHVRLAILHNLKVDISFL